MPAEFHTFDDFLIRTAGDDRQFLLEEELTRFPPVACGMANGSGGWIVLGATEEEGEPAVRGVSNMPELRARVLSLTGGKTFSAPFSVSLHPLTGLTPLLIVRVAPAGWHDRPVCVKTAGGALRAYRRVEGVDLISGRGACFRLGLDALERLRDDRPVAGMTPLDEESVAAFREAVVSRRPQWAGLSMPAFLTRSLVLSDKSVTQAGAYLLGREGPLTRVELQQEGKEPVVVEARNLWRAYSLLPRLTDSLSDACAAAFRECFINALLHADYDADRPHGARILLTGRPVVAHVENPGTVRTWQGDSACRNFRLMKMFQLFSGARGRGWGLRTIRSYQPDFRLEQEPLELSTSAALRLERKPATPKPKPKPQLKFDFELPKPKPQPAPEPARPEPAEPEHRNALFGNAAWELEQAVAAMRAGRSE